MEQVPKETQQAIEYTIQVARQVLGSRLRAIYALGSLGYGGYVPGWSDIDIDLIVTDCGASAAELLEEGFQIRDAVHAANYSMVDIKCYTTTILNDVSNGYEYGIANRAVMVLDSAKLLTGQDVSTEIQRPSQLDLCIEAVTVAHSLYNKPSDWWITRPCDDVAALFALPGRLLITSRNGKVVNKVPALEFLLTTYQESLPPGAWTWVVWALACRSITLARLLPDHVLADAQQSARQLLGWSLPLLESQLEQVRLMHSEVRQ